VLKTIIAVFIITAVSLMSPSKSQAQTVREDDNSGQSYFERAAKELCGPRARVFVSFDHAFVLLSGEYLADRNLDAVARNLAVDGLNAFPESQTFYVDVQDSRGTGYAAEVRR
jgi:hypothetical protein